MSGSSETNHWNKNFFFYFFLRLFACTAVLTTKNWQLTTRKEVFICFKNGLFQEQEGLLVSKEEPLKKKNCLFQEKNRSMVLFAEEPLRKTRNKNLNFCFFVSRRVCFKNKKKRRQQEMVLFWAAALWAVLQKRTILLVSRTACFKNSKKSC